MSVLLTPFAAASGPPAALQAEVTFLDQPPGRPWALGLELTVTPADLAAPPTAPVDSIVIRLPHATVNADQFPSCEKDVLTQRGPSGCRRGSRIGSGEATVDVRPFLMAPVVADLAVFNGPASRDARHLEVYAQVRGFAIDLVFDATLRRLPGSAYGSELRIDIPPIVPIAGVAPAAVASFQVSVASRLHRHREIVSYLEAPQACPHLGLPFGASFHYSDGAASKVSVRLPCTLGVASAPLPSHSTTVRRTPHSAERGAPTPQTKSPTFRLGSAI